MSSRATPTIVLAVVLILAVMGVAAAMTFSGPRDAKFAVRQAWSQQYAVAESMKIIDLTGDGQDELFVQNAASLGVYDANGSPLFGRDFRSPLATTLGDVNGDGAEDVVVFARLESSPAVTVIANGETLWTAQVADVSQPARAAVVRFPGETLIVVGDDDGRLVALTTDGNEAWRANLSSGDVIRGLDEALVDGQVYLAAANHDGSVALYDAEGQPRWTYRLVGTLRRLRAYDLEGDGVSEVLVGGDGNRLAMLDAASGSERVQWSLGQAITEIREAELDGDPASREFVVGGKEGGVWAYQSDGAEMWSASVAGKVTEIAGVDVDDDGAEEAVVGDETGGLTLFAGASGARHGLPGRPSEIARIDAGRLTGSDQIVVADQNSVQLLSLQREEAPFFYTPLVAGLVISVVIAVVAWFVASIPPKPALRVAVEDQSVEGLLARRQMLHESLADVDRLKQSGEMPPEAYLARLKELRRQLAEADVALQKAGAQVKPETFKCPNCGGPLPLGLDKCDYCGQVVIA